MFPCSENHCWFCGKKDVAYFQKDIWICPKCADSDPKQILRNITKRIEEIWIYLRDNHVDELDKGE